MKKTFLKYTAALLLSGLFIGCFQNTSAQSDALAVLDSAQMEAQLNYVHEHTRVYNNFRAIRDDIFLLMKSNVIDTLNATKLEIAHLNSELQERDFQIETLNSDLSRTRTERDESIRNKDSLSIFGIQMNKTVYNSVMWLIILGLATAAVLMGVFFRRAHLVTSNVKKELSSTQEELEQYRKSSREKYEKLVVSHHSEIMKLKNN
jgi:septal ring factor EnvC (AmiA/AmiB activator)